MLKALKKGRVLLKNGFLQSEGKCHASFFFAYCDFKTSKFDWMPDNIWVEKISNKNYPFLIK